jgi:hypothetical protein
MLSETYCSQVGRTVPSSRIGIRRPVRASISLPSMHPSPRRDARTLMPKGFSRPVSGKSWIYRVHSRRQAPRQLRVRGL